MFPSVSDVVLFPPRYSYLCHAVIGSQATELCDVLVPSGTRATLGLFIYYYLLNCSSNFLSLFMEQKEMKDNYINYCVKYLNKPKNVRNYEY